MVDRRFLLEQLTLGPVGDMAYPEDGMSLRVTDRTQFFCSLPIWFAIGFILMIGAAT